MLDLREVFLTKPAILALADGSIFRGEAIGADGQTVGEVVFNTAMTGYQEILTDPSYAQQIVTLTYPHIGNTGTTPEDAESNRVWSAGLVIRDLPLLASNWRNTQSLPDYLKANNVVAIAGIDTRRLTRILREKGAQNGCILAGDNISEEAAIAAARARGVEYLLTLGEATRESAQAFGAQADLKLGAELAVYTGDVQAPTEVFRGKVSAIELLFNMGGAPEITVLAEDALHAARLARRSKTYTDMSPADVVRHIPGFPDEQSRAIAATYPLPDGSTVHIDEGDGALDIRVE